MQQFQSFKSARNQNSLFPIDSVFCRRRYLVVCSYVFILDICVYSQCSSATVVGVTCMDAGWSFFLLSIKWLLLLCPYINLQNITYSCTKEAAQEHKCTCVSSLYTARVWHTSWCKCPDIDLPADTQSRKASLVTLCFSFTMSDQPGTLYLVTRFLTKRKQSWVHFIQATMLPL